MRGPYKYFVILRLEIGSGIGLGLLMESLARFVSVLRETAQHISPKLHAYFYKPFRTHLSKKK